MLKFYVQVFLCDGQGAVRRAILSLRQVLLDKSFSKAFAISEEDSMCPNAIFCSTSTCCLDYISNDKAGHFCKMMSSGVRKRKWHKLCNRLFTVFVFQKFNTDIAVVYSPKIEMHHNFWKRV